MMIEFTNIARVTGIANGVRLSAESEACIVSMRDRCIRRSVGACIRLENMGYICHWRIEPIGVHLSARVGGHAICAHYFVQVLYMDRAGREKMACRTICAAFPHESSINKMPTVRPLINEKRCWCDKWGNLHICFSSELVY